MLLGFISLMLNVFQGATQKICVRESVMHHLLPCPRPPPRAPKKAAHYGAAAFTGVLGSARRLLAGGGASSDYCLKKVRTICRLPCFAGWDYSRGNRRLPEPVQDTLSCLTGFRLLDPFREIKVIFCK
jgi:hypothetical protein